MLHSIVDSANVDSVRQVCDAPRTGSGQSILALVCPGLEKDHVAEIEYETVVKSLPANTAPLSSP